MFIIFKHCTDFSNASQNITVNPTPVMAMRSTVFAADKNEFFSGMTGVP